MSEPDYRYLLDTNIVSDMVRNPSGRAATQLSKIDTARICTSIIVACELRFGVVRRASTRLARRVEAVLSILPILPLESPVESHYGRIRAALAAEGNQIGSNDLLIAAHASALGLIVVTDNIREFDRVAGLQIENWLGV